MIMFWCAQALRVRSIRMGQTVNKMNEKKKSQKHLTILPTGRLSSRKRVKVTDFYFLILFFFFVHLFFYFFFL